MFIDVQSFRVIDANLAACKLLSYDTRSIRGLGAHELYPFPVTDNIHEWYRNLLNTGSAVADTEILTSQGTIVPVRISLRILEDYTTRVLACQIEERGSATGSVTENEFGEDNVLEHEAVVVLDGMTISDSNEWFRRLFHLRSQEEAHGRPISDFLKIPGAESDEPLREAITELQTTDVLGVRADGTQVRLTFKARLFFSRNKEFAALVLNFTNADDYQDGLQPILEIAEQLESVGQMAAKLSHNYNNYLAGILGSAESLLAEPAITGESQQALQAIISSCRGAQDLTNQLLTFTGKVMAKPAVVAIDSRIEKTFERLEDILGPRVTLRLDLKATDLRVKIDPNHVGRILEVLASNSRDAMPHGGTFTVKTRRVTFSGKTTPPAPGLESGEFILLSVADTGDGVPKDILPRVFEPLFTTKGLYSTGMGLSLAYGMVKNAGGAINLHSEIGMGVSVQIFLPVTSERPTPVPQASSRNIPISMPRAVLVVEDDQIVRTMIQRVLRRWGYRVFEAANGPEALDLFPQIANQVEVVISDVMMPHMSGTDLLKRLRESNPKIRALLISGFPGDHLKGLQDLNPPAKFLQKPFSLSELHKELQKILPIEKADS